MEHRIGLVFPQPVPSPPSTVHGCPQLEALSSTGPGRLPTPSARGKFNAFATPPHVMIAVRRRCREYWTLIGSPPTQMEVL